MKKVLLVFIALFITRISLAQELMNWTRDRTFHITEDYVVLNSNHNIKMGLYTATYKNKTVAKGYYKNNQRVGIWNFFDQQGKLVQTYNYDDKKLTYNDTSELANSVYHAKITYILDTEPQKTDSVTRPVKIGGGAYAMSILLDRTGNIKLLKQRPTDDKIGFTMTRTQQFTINNKGEILQQQTIVILNDAEEISDMDNSNIEPELQQFIPATINGRAVGCTISFTYNLSHKAGQKVIKRAL